MLLALLEEKAELRFLVVVVPQLALAHMLQQLLEASTGEAVLVVLVIMEPVSAVSPVFLTQEPLV